MKNPQSEGGFRHDISDGILNLLCDGDDMTIAALAEELGESMSVVRKQIKSMREDGLILFVRKRGFIFVRAAE